MTKTLQSFKSKKIEWLAINSSHFSNIKKNKEWHSARKLPYKVLDDHKGLVGRKYSAKTTPQMFIINPKGVLVYKGAIDSDPRMGKGKKVNYVLKALKNVFAAKKIDPTKTKPYGCSVKYK